MDIINKYHKGVMMTLERRGGVVVRTDAERESESSKKELYVKILIGLLMGTVSLWLSTESALGDVGRAILSGIGAGLFATSLVTFYIDKYYDKYRGEVIAEAIGPLLDNLSIIIERLEFVEQRIAAINQLGLRACYRRRSEAIEKFYEYSKEFFSNSKQNNRECARCKTIEIASSSARGLIGFLDREATQIQQQWRELIASNPNKFKFLLTHPSYAYLRQPAEERDPGAIELEIIKTLLYFVLIVGIDDNNLKLYRGSPTTFLINVDNKILLNPYPYGKMAMNSMCLELWSEDSRTLASEFANMHFNHTWSFDVQPSKGVNGKDLVVKIQSLDDILDAFCECTKPDNNTYMRLTTEQVLELDIFLTRTLPTVHDFDQGTLPSETPFVDRIIREDLVCADGLTFDPNTKEPIKA